MIPIVSSAFILQAMPGTNAQVRDQHSFMASCTTCRSCDNPSAREVFFTDILKIPVSTEKCG